MPTLEEINDDEFDVDNMDFDPAEFDPKNPFSKSTPASGSGANLVSTGPAPQQRRPQPQQMQQQQQSEIPRLTTEEELEQFKHWHVVYPVYFDKNKSHAQGRRVSKEMAVESPLATNLMSACKDIGIHCILEAHKTHPKDWSNPGRVRISIKADQNTMAPRVPINNKRHLYRILAQYLKTHPTTERMPFNSNLVMHMRQSGVQVPEKSEPLSEFKGVNSIVPLNSRVVSGGEQTDEMAKQMQDSLFGGMPQLPQQQKQKKFTVRR